MNRKASNRFHYIKRLINSDNDVKERIDMFYYNRKAINFVCKLHCDYFMNEYYNLTPIDILLMVDENKNIKEVHDYLYNEYDSDYACALFENFIMCLDKNIQ